MDQEHFVLQIILRGTRIISFFVYFSTCGLKINSFSFSNGFSFLVVDI